MQLFAANVEILERECGVGFGMELDLMEFVNRVEVNLRDGRI
jgi:hypothetical protein